MQQHDWHMLRKMSCWKTIKFNYLLITSLIRGWGRLNFEAGFSLADFGGRASFDWTLFSFDDKDGASGNLRISLVNRIHPAARSSVLHILYMHQSEEVWGACAIYVWKDKAISLQPLLQPYTQNAQALKVRQINYLTPPRQGDCPDSKHAPAHDTRCNMSLSPYAHAPTQDNI